MHGTHAESCKVVAPKADVPVPERSAHPFAVRALHNAEHKSSSGPWLGKHWQRLTWVPGNASILMSNYATSLLTW